MTHNCNHAKHLFGLGQIDFETVTVGVLLVVTGSDVATNVDATSLDDYSSLLEHSGANYARQLIAPAASTWTKDAPGNRSILMPDADTVFATLGDHPGALPAIGLLSYIEAATDALRIPLRYVNQGGFPVNATGQDFTIDWHDVDGLYLIGDAA